MADNSTAVQSPLCAFVLLFLFCLHTSVSCLHACYSTMAETNLTLRHSQMIKIKTVHFQANQILFIDGQLQSRKDGSCVS